MTAHPRAFLPVFIGLMMIGLVASCRQSTTTGTKPSGKLHHVAVLRLGDETEGTEGSETDIKRGLKEGGLEEGTDYDLMVLDAKGDISQVPALLKKASDEGAELIFTLHPETALAVSKVEDIDIPLVFQMAGDPVTLGLSKDDQTHDERWTGLYTSIEKSLVVEIIRNTLPNAKKFGVLYNPDNLVSLGDVNALKRARWEQVEMVTAEFRSPDEIGPALKTLLETPVEAIILVRGLGSEAPTVIKTAREAKVPVFGFTRGHVEAGAIMAQLPEDRYGAFQAGRRAARILRGESPGVIPLGQGPNHKTLANPVVLKELGLTLPGFLRQMEMLETE